MLNDSESSLTPMRRVSKLLRRVMIGFKTRLDDELKDHQVTTAQLRLLHEVQERPGGSGAQLARACFVTPQSAQTMLVRAVKRGWVVRGKDPENERLVTMRLTPAGSELLEYAEGVAQRLEAEIWGGVSAEEMKGLTAVLEKVAENLRD